MQDGNFVESFIYIVQNSLFRQHKDFKSIPLSEFRIPNLKNLRYKIKMIEALKQWAFTLVITAVVGSIAMSVTVSENGRNIKKYIKFACSLVALVVMISPIHGLFQGLPSLFNLNGAIPQSQTETGVSDNSDDIKKMNDILIEKTQELLKERISSSIYQKTGIKPENIYIYIKQNDTTETASDLHTEIDIDKIEVYMPENTGENEAKETEQYVKELLNCDVYVNVNTNNADNISSTATQ